MSSKLEVAKLLIRNADDDFLIVREKESGQWELPGGCIEKDDNDRFDAARREIKEETGLDVRELEDVVRVEVEETGKESGTVNCWILFSDSFQGEINLDQEEIDDYRWVKPEEFREMDWHQDAGYVLPPMVYLEKYLN